jgi:hypothetical protein
MLCLYFVYSIIYIFIHSVWIRIAINADPDQNYPPCGSELSSEYTTDQWEMQRRLFLFVSVWMKKRIAAAILLSRVAKIVPRHNRKQNKEEVHSKIGPPASGVVN